MQIPIKGIRNAVSSYNNYNLGSRILFDLDTFTVHVEKNSKYKDNKIQWRYDLPEDIVIIQSKNGQPANDNDTITMNEIRLLCHEAVKNHIMTPEYKEQLEVSGYYSAVTSILLHMISSHNGDIESLVIAQGITKNNLLKGADREDVEFIENALFDHNNKAYDIWHTI